MGAGRGGDGAAELNDCLPFRSEARPRSQEFSWPRTNERVLEHKAAISLVWEIPVTNSFFNSLHHYCQTSCTHGGARHVSLLTASQPAVHLPCLSIHVCGMLATAPVYTRPHLAFPRYRSSSPRAPIPAPACDALESTLTSLVLAPESPSCRSLPERACSLRWLLRRLMW